MEGCKISVANENPCNIPKWKRSFDVLFSLLAVFITLLIMIPIAVAIKLTDGGSIFFRHERIGFRGRKFKVLKFRSMYPDADRRLKEILEKDPKAREEWEKNFNF